MSARRTLATLSAVALVAVTASACSSDVLATSQQSSTHTPVASKTSEPVTITTNVARRDVPVDTVLTVGAEGGTLDTVTVSSAAGAVPGTLTGGSWQASTRLEPGTTYTLVTTATTPDGQTQRDRSRFRTQDLTLAQQTFASIAPLQGETVGVGMPVIVTFDVPVTDRASMERHMQVTSVPAQRGAWHWLSNTEVHWRPATYWKAGSDVTVNLDIDSVSAGGGIFGQESRHVTFHVGDAHIYRVNAQSHEMKVFDNGKLLRTIPITTGKQGFVTRSGIKVIIEKFRSKTMNSSTIGIDPNSPEGYDLNDVEYAMRLTYSGEFIHAAPWSESSQGLANVSHGCTGMSTPNAAWLYAMSVRGDVVQYTGTNRPMTLTNGYGDWNESFSEWKAGSAL